VKLRIAAAAGVVTELTRDALPSAAYDWVVEATGNSEALRQAVAMTRPRGTLILKSTVHGLVGTDTAPIIVNELTLVGSRCGRLEVALPLLDHHLIRAEELISARYRLADAPQAFAHAARPGTLKVLLYP
jgi:alcohol dehydrogenase